MFFFKDFKPFAGIGASVWHTKGCYSLTKIWLCQGCRLDNVRCVGLSLYRASLASIA